MSAGVPWLSVVAICGGASLGALARWQLGRWLSPSDALLPWGTLVANAAGGYLVGVCMGVLPQWPDLHPAWRLACVTGFLGALTTFSTFSHEVVALLQQGRPLWALGLAALHLLASLALTALGLHTAAIWGAR